MGIKRVILLLIGLAMLGSVMRIQLEAERSAAVSQSNPAAPVHPKQRKEWIKDINPNDGQGF